MFSKITSFFVSILIFICSVLGINYKSNISKKSLENNVSRNIQKEIDNGNMFGARVMVYQDGEEILNGCYGVDGLNGNPIKSNSIFRIASMTKPVTALALLIAQDKGLLSIYDDLADYLPEYKTMYVGKKAENGAFVPDKLAQNSIKLYMLVSHCSGIGNGEIGNEQYFSVLSQGFTQQSVSEKMAQLPLVFEPGTSQGYSNASFDMAARVIEIVSGMEYSEFLKVNIFDKLGMNDTTFEPSEEQFSRMVELFSIDAEGKVQNQPNMQGVVFGNIPVEYHFAAGGLASTADDYMKLAMAMLNNGVGENGVRIISEETYKLFYTPVVSEEIMGKNNRWALGVMVNTSSVNTLPKGSYYWSGAYGTHFWVDPVNRITAVFMINTTQADKGYTSGDFQSDVISSLKIGY